MNHKKIRNVVIFVFFVCLCIYAIHIYVSKSRIEGMQNVDLQNQYFDADISIPRTIQLEPGELIEINLPSVALSGYDLSDMNQAAQEFKETLENKGINIKTIYGNQDKTLAVTFDSYNFELYLELIENNFNSVIGNDVSVNKTFSHMIYNVDDESTFMIYGFRVYQIYGFLALSQILTGTPCHEWEVSVTTMYEPKEIIMFEHTIYEGVDIHISEEEWLEKLQEAQGK